MTDPFETAYEFIREQNAEKAARKRRDLNTKRQLAAPSRPVREVDQSTSIRAALEELWERQDAGANPGDRSEETRMTMEPPEFKPENFRRREPGIDVPFGEPTDWHRVRVLVLKAVLFVVIWPLVVVSPGLMTNLMDRVDRMR
jgi:hypothetical protein